MTDPDWYNNRLSLLTNATRHLSREEMDELVEYATELEQGGIKLRAHVAARHLVAKCTDWGDDEVTVERVPTPALLNEVANG